MRGDVRLENNGGFIQTALDLGPRDGTFPFEARKIEEGLPILIDRCAGESGAYR